METHLSGGAGISDMADMSGSGTGINLFLLFAAELKCLLYSQKGFSSPQNEF